MKRLLLFLAFALAAMPLCAADLAIQTPTDPVAVGSTTQLSITGLTAADLPKCKLIVWPRDSVQTIAGQTWGGEPYVLFIPSAQGKYLVSIVVPGPNNTLRYAEGVVQVNPPKPAPDPAPTPDPQPVVKKAAEIVILEQDSQRTPAQAQIFRSLAIYRLLQAKGLKWAIVDRDAPGAYAPLFSGVDDSKLPLVVVRAADGSTITTKPLGTSEAEAVKFLEGLNP